MAESILNTWADLLAPPEPKNVATLDQLADTAPVLVPSPLVAMLEDQKLFNVATFAGEDYEEGRDRYEVSTPSEAHVASSLVRGHDPEPLHRLVIDVDHPVHAVPSSTPGHFHLYVDTPPIPDAVYWKLVDVLVEAGLVEPGYRDASKHRGHTDVRLPWVRKVAHPPVTTDDFDVMLEETP